MAQTSPVPIPNPDFTPSSIESRRRRLTTQISVITTIFAAAASFAFLGALFTNESWQLLVLATAFAIAWITSGVAATDAVTDNPVLQILMSAGGLILALMVVAALVEGVGVPLAVIVLIISIIVSTSSLSAQLSDLGISIGLVAAVATALLNSASFIDQISMPILLIYIPALLGILVMMYVAMVTMEFIVMNLRIKFITGALAIAVVPLVLMSFIDSRFVQNALQNQTNQALHLAAEQSANRIDEFLQTNILSVEQESTLPAFINYLMMDPQKRAGSPEEQEMRLVVESLRTKQKAHLYSYGLLNIRGDIVFDTNPSQVGKNEISRSYFTETVSSGQPYISPVQYDPDNGDAFIFFMSPIRNEKQQMIGVLELKYDALILQYFLEDYRNLIGSRSYPVLLDDNFIRIADTITPKDLYKSIVPLSVDRLSSLQRLQQAPRLPAEMMATNLPQYEAGLQNYQLTPFFSVDVHPESTGHVESAAVVQLINKPWYLVYMQEQTALTALLNNQSRVSMLIATLIAGLIGIIATAFTRVLSNPILSLQRTAQRISSGDLEATATIQANDEIGALGQAFNYMTAQLKSFIADLEDRVRERTKELAQQNQALVYRSNQLRTVADVARDVASAQELETLLNNVTRLISERFNYYHVGVFLIDEKGEYAVLRAANSQGGQNMLARKHSLKVGQLGIVGYVTGAGKPRIATDVGQDAVYFNNPDLPLTRSEMALPLMAANHVIGALDVQSVESNAFTQEDIDLFGTLADQIAIAIQNNRLFAETVQALEEAQNLHKRYLQQQWSQEIEDYSRKAYRYSPRGIMTTDPVTTNEVEKAVEEQKLIVDTRFDADSQSEETTLVVPILLRGETIGVINIQEKGDQARHWNDEEIDTIKAVADQVAIAMENARLFEQTVRRAERERKVFEITSKIRATNDPQQMLQIAVEELQQTLKATRAQIILEAPEPPTGNGKTNGNGHHQADDKAKD